MLAGHCHTSGASVGTTVLSSAPRVPQACSPGRGSGVGEKVEAHRAFGDLGLELTHGYFGIILLLARIQGAGKETTSLWKELKPDLAKSMCREGWSTGAIFIVSPP